MKPFRPFAFEDRPVKVRACDSPGCAVPGDFRAPRQRDTESYYWFCLEHVREYNSNWDYFKGMSAADIEAHIRKASVWDRPSWPMGEWQKREQELRDKVMRDFFGDGAGSPHAGAGAESAAPPMPTAERDALAILELTPPVDFIAIKAQYKLLVKRHHPDANGGSMAAEEKFKSINQAFTVLKEMHSIGGE